MRKRHKIRIELPIKLTAYPPDWPPEIFRAVEKEFTDAGVPLETASEFVVNIFYNDKGCVLKVRAAA